MFEEMPGGHYATKNGQRTYSWGIGNWDVVSLSPKKKDANSDGWTREDPRYRADNMDPAGDPVQTVAPNYAREILTPELGFGFDGALRRLHLRQPAGSESLATHRPRGLPRPAPGALASL